MYITLHIIPYSNLYIYAPYLYSYLHLQYIWKDHAPYILLLYDFSLDKKVKGIPRLSNIDHI
jgi:hypothetical protein